LDLPITTSSREGFLDMPAAHLRLYQGPETPAAPTLTKDADGRARITVALSDVLPLLAEAVNSQRTWLADFDDDEITVSADLYAVLLAYQYFRRPSA
jgi:hypothetical protein